MVVLHFHCLFVDIHRFVVLVFRVERVARRRFIAHHVHVVDYRICCVCCHVWDKKQRMTSILGFVAKDSGLSNANVSQSVAAPVVSTTNLAVTNLSVTNLVVAQTITTTDATTTTTFPNVTISQQLVIAGNNMSNEILFSDTDTLGTLTLNVQPQTRGLIYTIPDIGENASFILSEGNQAINGRKTFTSPLTYAGSNISNELVFNDTATGGTLTLNVQPVTQVSCIRSQMLEQTPCLS